MLDDEFRVASPDPSVGHLFDSDEAFVYAVLHEMHLPSISGGILNLSNHLEAYGLPLGDLARIEPRVQRLWCNDEALTLRHRLRLGLVRLLGLIDIIIVVLREVPAHTRHPRLCVRRRWTPHVLLWQATHLVPRTHGRRHRAGSGIHRALPSIRPILADKGATGCRGWRRAICLKSTSVVPRGCRAGGWILPSIILLLLDLLLLLLVLNEPTRVEDSREVRRKSRQEGPATDCEVVHASVRPHPRTEQGQTDGSAHQRERENRPAESGPRAARQEGCRLSHKTRQTPPWRLKQPPGTAPPV
mmetsp:Transcript_143380/g.458304  ORF Transcript_143380/g.458304 Transcript_143380/m.458304 type:complete len:301 (-) Transcript_143380:16-918(-)